MSEYVERLTAADFEETMDLLDLAFNRPNKNQGFETLLPRIYKKTDESMSNNFAIRKNGRIRAIVGVYPMIFQSGLQTLKFAAIGSVATHARFRNSGLMRQLMKAGIQEMRSQGYHLTGLAGHRQRYGYYGYEKSGIVYSFIVTKNNINKSLSFGNNESSIRFEPVTENSFEWLSYAKKLYDAQPFHCNRPINEFYLYLKSWNMNPWAAIDKNEKMVGYLVNSKSKHQVSEIFADSANIFSDMVAAWVSQYEEDSVTFTLPPWEQNYIRKISSICESVTASGSYNWRIFDWVRVINTLFSVKLSYTKLAEGEVKIGIEDCGVFSLCVKNGKASCKKINGNPDLYCDEFSAVRLLFGPLKPDNVMELPENLVPIFSSWFPLPLSWGLQDRV